MCSHRDRPLSSRARRGLGCLVGLAGVFGKRENPGCDYRHQSAEGGGSQAVGLPGVPGAVLRWGVAEVWGSGASAAGLEANEVCMCLAFL